jgi:alanine-synthesizing transaminase
LAPPHNPGFSSRFKRQLAENKLTQLLRLKREEHAAVVDLTVSNPTAVGFRYNAERLLEPLVDPANLTYEPSPTGLESARAAVAGYYRELGHTVDPERIVLTSSTSEGYSYLFKLLTDPGDELLAPRPSYPLFDFLAEMEHVRLRPYRLSYDGRWRIDFDSLERALTERSRTVLVVNPNNPTGSFVGENEAAKLVGFCREAGLTLIADEVFIDFSLVREVQSLVAYDNSQSIIVSGLSKLAGLPQMKLAWIVLGGSPSQVKAMKDRLEIISDTYLSVSTPAQRAAPHWLQSRRGFQQDLISRLRQNVAYLRKMTAGSPCELLHVEGGWSAIVRLPRTRSEEEWALTLLELDNVHVQPGYFYDFESEAYVVVSLITPPERFREGCQRLVARSRRTG